MKSIRNLLIGIIITGGLAASLHFLHAQTAVAGGFNGNIVPIQSSAISTVDWNTASDMQVLLQAVEMLPTVSANSTSRAGTFWSAQHAPGSSEPWPPLPSNVRQFDAWNLGDNVFLLNDLNWNYSAPFSSLRMAGGGMRAMDDSGGPIPGDSGGGGGTNDFYSDSFNFIPNYGTNLWLAITNVTPATAFLFVSNTVADIQYEIQYKTDLAQSDWQSANWFLFGSEITNWTPASMSRNGTTNLFLRVRSWQDDGSGLPLWWQEQYFGTTGVDPYGNPAGDGWNNLHKFQKGMNPNAFYTPPAPQGLTVQYNSVNNTAAINWSPSPGPVTGYTVERDYYSSPTDFSASTNNFEDDNVPGIDMADFWLFGPSIPVSYKVQAHYAGGNSAWSAPVLLEPNPQSLSVYSPPPVSIIPGPQGSVYLAAPVLPSGTVALRVFRYNAVFDPSPLTNFDIPVSNITNGLYAIPASWSVARTNVYGYTAYEYWIQPVITNAGPGSAGAYEGHWGSYYPEDMHNNQWLVPPYFDGRAQLKQNLIFQLRAATKDFPFEYTATWWGYNPWMVFSNSPNYVYAGFYQLDEVPNQYSTYEQLRSFDPLWPFENNWRYRNFVFSPQDAGTTTNYYFSRYGLGHILTSVFGDYDTYYQLIWPYTPTPLVLGPPDSDSTLRPVLQPKYVFQTPTGLTNGAAIPAFLDASTTRWLASYPLDSSEGDWVEGTNGIWTFVSSGYLEEIGVTPSSDATYNTYRTMASNARNYWGLPLLSANIAYDDGSGNLVTTTLNAGGQVENIDGYFYPETAQPQFQTTEYDFWNSSPLPGMTNFVNGQASDLLIAPVDRSTMINGYAKLAVLNGYSGVYGYLGQYFDKAYKIANGIVTTNQTGLLSSYGDFFATEPGPAALVTMPDIDTGQRGTGVVYCASLQVDKNHDGVMDFSFSGADATAQGSPMEYWVNSGWDDQNGVDRPNYGNTNYMDAMINWPRDLENFARLWVCGVPALPSAQGYCVTLSWQNVIGNPAVNLFRSVETNGGIGYLTDTNVAAEQTDFELPNGAGLVFAQVQSGTTFTFPANFFTNNANKYFLFEGAGIGSGELTLTVWQGTNAIAQTGVWVDLHDIKDFYEQAHIAGVSTTFPAMVNTTNTSSFVSDHEVSPSTDETKQLVVFVHGWRMGMFDYQDFSDTMFKRLYWAGYHGRFASLRWSTLSADDYKVLSDLLSYTTFNRSEHIAFDSGAGACAYLDWLKSRLPDYLIGVTAHSMGNVLMAEALKDQLAEGHHVIDNYVMMQAAMTAHCYNTGLPNYSVFTAAEASSPTPDIYRGYPGSIGAAVNNQIINFFNPNDFALATGTFLTANVNWEGNQKNYKPDWVQGYTSDGTICFHDVTSVVTNPHEQMAFAARPRAKAAGALEGISGAVSGELDLKANYGFDTDSHDHSAEFNWNIQQLGGPNGFYKTLLQDLFQ
jgi:hypothetical protein